MNEDSGQSRQEDRSAGARRAGRASWIAAAGGAVVVGIAIAAAACSLGNIKHDDCTSDAQCASLFGAGSKCDQGYCTSTGNVGCEKPTEAGYSCFSCPPKAGLEFENACTQAECVPFNQKHLTKLTPDGGLPALP